MKRSKELTSFRHRLGLLQAANKDLKSQLMQYKQTWQEKEIQANQIPTNLDQRVEIDNLKTKQSELEKTISELTIQKDKLKEERDQATVKAQRLGAAYAVLKEDKIGKKTRSKAFIHKMLLDALKDTKLALAKSKYENQELKKILRKELKRK